jgi:RNA polymerase sigma factor (sigma-70 family)
MPDQDFAALLHGLRTNQPDAARALLDKYGDAIRREARLALVSRDLKRIVSDSDVCQSVLAQLFVGLWTGSIEVESDEHLIGLLRTMVRARIVDLHRRHTARKRDIRRNQPLNDDGPAMDDRSQLSPSAELMHREICERVTSALPERIRSILGLRQEQRGWPEIATILGEQGRGEAIRKQFERAMAKVSESLQSDLSP